MIVIRFSYMYVETYLTEPNLTLDLMFLPEVFKLMCIFGKFLNSGSG